MDHSAWARVNRHADDAIYLGEDRFEKPKEVFKRFGAILQSHHAHDSRLRILDAGCALSGHLNTGHTSTAENRP